MPQLNSTTNLTNQELLQELEKRVQAGTIQLNYHHQVEADPLTAKLFKIQVGKGATEANPKTSLFNRNTLLWIALGTLAFFLIYQKSLTIKSSLEFQDNSPAPSSSLCSSLKLNQTINQYDSTK